MSTKPIDRWIGAQVRSRRERLGLTLRDLSEETGFGVTALAAFERGTLRVGAAKLLALAKALNVGALYFFGEDAAHFLASQAQSGAERREHTRFAADGAVEIRAGSLILPASIRDISSHGLSALGLRGHDVGVRVRVEHANFICHGRVVWVAEDRGGVRFDFPLPFDIFGSMIRDQSAN